jgi:hemerythrin-like metal-binding protein
MTIMQWNDKLEVGVESMNDEHRALLDWMNRLHDREAAGASKAEIVMLARQLQTSAVKHFRSEEAYMASIGFAGLRNHRQIHDSLLETLTRHVTAIAEGDGKVPRGFFTFLKVWLTAHIQGVDAKYSPRRVQAAA